MAWLALLIPIITSVILLQFYREKVVWWEFVILFAISPLVILLCKFGAETSMTTDTEYWGSYATEVRYYEDWNETVSCIHSNTDKDGNITGYDHAYDVDYHSEYWQLHDSLGEQYIISEGYYNNLRKRWNNQSFHDMRRDHHTNDGDMYKSKYDRNEKHMEPLSVAHRYTNKVQASTSVFNFPEVVDPSSYGLHNYPSGDLYRPSILGNVHDKAVANRYLDIENAKMGSSHQVRVWFLFFKGDMSVALEQENYWKGGNKNEFVVCIGIDKEQNVTWCKPFTWCEVDTISATVRNEIASHEGKIDTLKFAKFTVAQIKKHWVRKQFAEFNYLTVDLPVWAFYLIWIVTLLVNIGLGFFVVRNDVDEKTEARRRKYKSNRWR